MCGIVGIYSERKIKLMPLLYFGLLGVQHRGQEARRNSFVKRKKWSRRPLFPADVSVKLG